jgi:hypothetical protein
MDAPSPCSGEDFRFTRLDGCQLSITPTVQRGGKRVASAL